MNEQSVVRNEETSYLKCVTETDVGVNVFTRASDTGQSNTPNVSLKRHNFPFKTFNFCSVHLRYLKIYIIVHSKTKLVTTVTRQLEGAGKLPFTSR